MLISQRSLPLQTTGINISLAISNLRFRFITLALPHSLFSMDLPVCMDVHCNPGALTICTKKPVIPGENLNGTVHPLGNVPEKQE